MTIRQAIEDDIPALEILIAASVRGLQSAHYSSAQMEGALGTVFGVDRQLIRDGTYFAVVVDWKIVGCGGWSSRKTLFGSDHVAGKDDAQLDPALDAARIRAFFVDPGWARRGIGSMILETCEMAARRAGFSRLELMATLTGEALYRARGFTPMEYVSAPLPNGEALPVIRMTKRVA